MFLTSSTCLSAKGRTSCRARVKAPISSSSFDPVAIAARLLERGSADERPGRHRGILMDAAWDFALRRFQKAPGLQRLAGQVRHATYSIPRHSSKRFTPSNILHDIMYFFDTGFCLTAELLRASFPSVLRPRRGVLPLNWDKIERVTPA